MPAVALPAGPGRISTPTSVASRLPAAGGFELLIAKLCFRWLWWEFQKLMASLVLSFASRSLARAIRIKYKIYPRARHRRRDAG
jgi:hypothetical protein